jgi:hypothetical protein
VFAGGKVLVVSRGCLWQYKPSIWIPDGSHNTNLRLETQLPFGASVKIDQGHHVSGLCDENADLVRQKTRSMLTEYPYRLIVQINRFE